MTPTEHEMTLAYLRDGLGMVCQHVARTNDVVVVTRYGKGIAALVPLWEWRFFKELEADLRDGRKRIVDEIPSEHVQDSRPTSPEAR